MAKIDDSVKKKVPELRFKGFTDEWEERKLGDLGSVAMNKRIFKEQTSDVGDIPFYKIGTFGGTPDAFISRDIFEEYKSKYQYPEVGDILISASGSIGRTVVYQGYDEYFQDSNIVWLKHDQQLDNSFLKQFYSIVKWQGLEGSTIKRLYNKNILETKITLPSPEEQQKIGSFFKQLDNTITLHQRKLDLLKEQKKGYLQKMFPKNGAKVPELRFAGFADDWEQRKLNEVSDIYDGTHQTPKYQDNGVMFLSVENIKTLTSNKFISREAFEDEFKIRPQRGDVLMTRIGDIGTANVVETDEDLAYYVSLALFKSEELNPYFLQASIYAPFVQDQIWKRTLHIAFPKKINKNEIGQVPINVPTLAEQTKIGSFFKQLDNTITLHQRKLDLLKEQKKGFLQKMFV
ncbi:Type I restriction-modification system,specificity subunit S [Lactococcus lactis subsp. lactis Dephy 1]|uniref:restriction endonuclease subunit S n=1 Tax=Lactococcus lactis TaxID=1358 RepID=UPI0003B7EC27|nr:restriction endonuclease subunit S [Lactococcus lactis]CDI47516.1 Type I restriction-modification system,specificity subunit S [Lactococcus lactis subsp. lactis Dephy 1]